MKKYFIILFFILVACFSIEPSKVSAQSTSSNQTEINARILPTIWYSTLSINEGDNVKINAGIQNNSGLGFTGMATFLVDDKEISKIPFSSTADSLKDISANWIANSGDHSVQVKISSTSLASGKTLVSYDSDKSNVSIIKKITPVSTKDAVLNTASSIVAKTDDLATSLANQLESLKKPITIAEKKADALGTSTSPTSNPNGKKNSQMDSVFNIFMDSLAFLVRNWKWTLSGLVVLFLLYKMSGRRRRR